MAEPKHEENEEAIPLTASNSPQKCFYLSDDVESNVQRVNGGGGNDHDHDDDDDHEEETSSLLESILNHKCSTVSETASLCDEDDNASTLHSCKDSISSCSSSLSHRKTPPVRNQTMTTLLCEATPPPQQPQPPKDSSDRRSFFSEECQRAELRQDQSISGSTPPLLVRHQQHMEMEPIRPRVNQVRIS